MGDRGDKPPHLVLPAQEGGPMSRFLSPLHRCVPCIWLHRCEISHHMRASHLCNSVALVCPLHKLAYYARVRLVQSSVPQGCLCRRKNPQAVLPACATRSDRHRSASRYGSHHLVSGASRCRALPPRWRSASLDRLYTNDRRTRADMCSAFYPSKCRISLDINGRLRQYAQRYVQMKR